MLWEAGLAPEHRAHLLEVRACVVAARARAAAHGFLLSGWALTRLARHGARAAPFVSADGGWVTRTVVRAARAAQAAYRAGRAARETAVVRAAAVGALEGGASGLGGTGAPGNTGQLSGVVVPGVDHQGADDYCAASGTPSALRPGGYVELADAAETESAWRAARSVCERGAWRRAVERAVEAGERARGWGTARPHKGAGRTVRFTPGGESIFSGGSDRSLQQRDVIANEAVWKQRCAHKSAINVLIPVGEHGVASGDDDGRVQVWDVRQ